MIGENPGPGLAVMMLAVAAAAVIQQVSLDLYYLSSLTCRRFGCTCALSVPVLLTLYGLTTCVTFYWVQVLQ